MEDNSTTPISNRFGSIARQEGLYIGLALGAVAGVLLSSPNADAALTRAQQLITLAQTFLGSRSSGGSILPPAIS